MTSKDERQAPDSYSETRFEYLKHVLGRCFDQISALPVNFWRRRTVNVDVLVAGKRWQACHKFKRLSENSEVVFIIPLVSRNKVKDWNLVEELLHSTLKSLISQVDTRWRAIICGTDRPSGVIADDRIEFVEYPVAHSDPEKFGKPPKVKYVLDLIAIKQEMDCYLFVLDADDLMSPELVRYMLRTADPFGYVIKNGYMFDAQSGDLGHLRPKRFSLNGSGAFFKFCGSCCAIRYQGKSDSLGMVPFYFRGTHDFQLNNLAAFGMKLKLIPFGAAVYVINHGESIRARRGKVDAQVRNVRRNLVDQKESVSVRRQFCLTLIRDKMKK